MVSRFAPFSVLDFSEQNFHKVIINERFSVSKAEEHQRVSYLYGYLLHLDTSTIVVENEYIDGDYLDDFIAVYATCFSKYERFCKRIHFFKIAISKKQLNNLIYNSINPEKRKEILDSYLGFIVVRPLPKAVIGRTVLKTYECDKGERGERYYTVTREYKPNFFGVEFLIEKSLAYQEQDRAVSACATVALWCCFHKTAKLFNTPLPSPATITRAANQIARDSRMIPSAGLSVEQICNAIHWVGLEPEVIDLELLDPKKDPIILSAYGYLKMGLPVIVIAKYYPNISIEPQSSQPRQEPQLHAITLTGFSITQKKSSFEQFPSKAQYIDELYGHDDQIGPCMLGMGPLSVLKRRMP
jgi:hypothetical protein